MRLYALSSAVPHPPMAEMADSCLTAFINLAREDRSQTTAIGASAPVDWAHRRTGPDQHVPHRMPHQIDTLLPFVDAFAHRYNHHRPHDALDGQTPAEYLKTFSSGHPPLSHMS